MGFDVRSLAPEYPVIEARYSGRVDRADLEVAFTRCLTLAIEQDTWRMLADFTDLIWTPTITDVLELVEAVSSLGVTDRYQEAHVRPTDVTAATSVGLWRMAGVNRGLDIREFRERPAAIDWLSS
jgi:hypothetical protein